MGALELHLATGGLVFIYPKDDHQPASFTILNFPVADIDAAVDGLTAKGVTLENYDMGPMQADAKGIYRGRAAEMGPDIAWFKIPPATSCPCSAAEPLLPGRRGRASARTAASGQTLTTRALGQVRKLELADGQVECPLHGHRTLPIA